MQDHWRHRPWPKELGDCILQNNWGWWVIRDGRKNGPYVSMEVVARVYPGFVLKLTAHAEKNVPSLPIQGRLVSQTFAETKCERVHCGWPVCKCGKK